MQLTASPPFTVASPPFNKEGISNLGKLLLNSWSAEYALRITELINDDEYLEHAKSWTFPQAYYAAFFGARAVLLVNGMPMSNESAINVTMSIMAQNGLYGPNTSGVINPYFELIPYGIHKKPTQLTPDDKKPSQLIPDDESPAFFLENLVDKVDRIAFIHEQQILNMVGLEVFQQIVFGIPEYLLDSFVWSRFQELTINLPAQ